MPRIVCLCTCSILKATQVWHAWYGVNSYSLGQNKTIKAARFSTAANLQPYLPFTTMNTIFLPAPCVGFSWRSGNGQGGITAYIFTHVYTHTFTEDILALWCVDESVSATLFSLVPHILSSPGVVPPWPCREIEWDIECGVHLRTARSLSLLQAGNKSGTSGDAENQLPLLLRTQVTVSTEGLCDQVPLHCILLHSVHRVNKEFFVSEMFFRACHPKCSDVISSVNTVLQLHVIKIYCFQALSHFRHKEIWSKEVGTENDF